MIAHLNRHQKLLEEARALLAQSEDETAKLREVVRLLEQTAPTQQSLGFSQEKRERPAMNDVLTRESVSTPAATEAVLRSANRPLSVVEIMDRLAAQFPAFREYEFKVLRSKVYSFIAASQNPHMNGICLSEMRAIFIAARNWRRRANGQHCIPMR